MFKEIWMSGVVLAFLSFGIKTGLGMGSRLFTKGAKKGVAVFIAATCASYLILFLALYFLIIRANLFNYLDQLVSLIQYGMLVHLCVASGLMIWGASLLVKPSLFRVGDQNGSNTRVGLFLVVPCPVCATVIGLNLTLALSLSDLAPFTVTLWLYALFFGIVSATLAVLYFFKGKQGVDNAFLGAGMVLISLYFFLTVLIAPVYPKIKPAYAMALSNSPVRDTDWLPMLILAAAVLVLFALGAARSMMNRSPETGQIFIKKQFKPAIRKKTCPIAVKEEKIS
jgi:predicted transporter